MIRHTTARKLAASLALGALVLGSAAPVAWADDDEDENEVPFSVAKLFFQLNDTDGGMGIHALIDGEPWKRLEIEEFRDRTLLVVSPLRASAPPGADRARARERGADVRRALARGVLRAIPEGDYEIEGLALQGDELENTVTSTHVMPAPAEDLEVGGEAAPEGCDEGPVVSDPILNGWSAVTESHPDIGEAGAVDIVEYEVDVEREEPTKPVLSFALPGDASQAAVPIGLFESGAIVEFQVLGGDAEGNETSTESCFEIL